MLSFELHILREMANEGIARHGLRGYARKLGLDVSTMRSLRDGRDMQISKVCEIVAAMDMALELRPSPVAEPEGGTTTSVQDQDATVALIAFHSWSGTAEGRAPIAFQPEWLAAQGWSLPDLACMTAPPEGAVPEGALCLIDTAPGWPGAHAIWAYLDTGVPMMRYLSRPGAGVLLIGGAAPSDAPLIVSGPALERITPLGRVLWAGWSLDADLSSASAADSA